MNEEELIIPLFLILGGSLLGIPFSAIFMIWIDIVTGFQMLLTSIVLAISSGFGLDLIGEFDEY